MSEKKTSAKKRLRILTKEKGSIEQFAKIEIEPVLSVAGHSVKRTDAYAKVTGKQIYGADYPQEGFLH